jgi:pimeloyl-ACP methyl ester carboxylesterase
MIKLFTGLLLLAWFSAPDMSNAAVHHERHSRLSGSTPDATVILVHGWSCDSTYWSEQLPALRRHFDVITIDLAGHGKTPATRADFSMASFGRDVAEVVAQLPADQPIVLVGHSMGGPVEAALLLGERVRGVIGVDTFASIGLPKPSAVENAARLAAFERDFRSTTYAFVSQSFFRADADPSLRERIANDMASADPKVALAAIQGLNDWDGTQRLPLLKQPIATINADQVPLDAARLQRYAPSFQLITLAGQGHFLMMENPTRFNPVLIETISGMLDDQRAEVSASR